MAVETIPLPTEKASNGDDFAVTVTDLTAWPNQKLRVEFVHNAHMDRWTWEAHHVGEGQIIRRNVAVLDHSHSHWPFITFQFLVPGGPDEIKGVTTDTLGDDVKLAVFPGPLGGQFLQNSGFTREEEQRLLTYGNISRVR